MSSTLIRSGPLVSQLEGVSQGVSHRRAGSPPPGPLPDATACPRDGNELITQGLRHQLRGHPVVR